MTKRETIDAFIRGDIDRRTFIGRLTTLGVSTGAAVAYATSFGSSALAAPASSQSGFVTLGQDDGDYGGPIDPGPLDNVVEILTGVFEDILALFDGFADFLPDDFGQGIFDGLQNLQNQLETQFDSLGSLPGFGAAATRGYSQRSRLAAVQPSGDPQAFLETVATSLDLLTGAFGAVVPGLDDATARQTMMNIAMVSGRHASFANMAAGKNPFPSAFQDPSMPER